jgi:hypothetical protein
MTSKNLHQMCSSLGELQLIILCKTVQAAKASQSLLTASDALSFRDGITAVRADVAFPQTEQMRFLRKSRHHGTRMA